MFHEGALCDVALLNEIKVSMLARLIIESDMVYPMSPVFDTFPSF